MEVPSAHQYVVFTDGACSGNPGPGGWGAIVAAPTGEVWELGGGAKQTTNNQMEILGTIEALASLTGHPPGPVLLYTDSVYVIRGITEWIHGWRRRGWQTAEGKPVANQELWERLSRVVYARKELGGIDWRFVKGHSGNPGNERCDEIAVAFTQNRKPKLYRGSLMGYDTAVMDLPPDRALPDPRDRPPKAAAHSYLSLVDGVPMRHATWGECERRVKGRSGARFKKTSSPADEAKVLSDWGVRL